VIKEIGCMVVKCICIETLQCLVECFQRTATCMSLRYDFFQKYFFDKWIQLTLLRVRRGVIGKGD
jgi:hypothetical protein